MKTTTERPEAAGAVGTVGSRLVRVEKGQANEEELAAVTALLLARAAASSASHAKLPAAGSGKAGWRRLERSRGFSAAHSWQG